MKDVKEIYSKNYKRLYHLAMSILHDNFLAEDVVQEVFIKVMKNIETLEDEDKLASWLSVITKRTAIDYLRKERKTRGILMEHDMLDSLEKQMKQNVEIDVETSMIQEKIQKAIETLTINYRNVLILKVREGLKEWEIAAALDLSPAAVKTRIHRARKQLKTILVDQIGA